VALSALLARAAYVVRVAGNAITCGSTFTTARGSPKIDIHPIKPIIGVAILAGSEAALMVHGFTAVLLAELERDGLATSTMGRVKAGVKLIDVKRFRITEAGTKALGG
jgi:hypothetical protein